jgi:hypothetical protein
VKTHQDNLVPFANLSRKAQLNCICNHTAKQQIALNGLDSLAPGRMFPLEPIGIFVNGEKMTSDTQEQIRFWAHRQLAWSYYNNRGKLSHEQFDKIDRPSVCETLHVLPWLFQIWAAKHTNNIAGTMTFLSHQYGRCKLCPSCQRCEETCQHVARCPEVGRTLAFKQSTNDIERWLGSNNTHLDMQHLLLWYLGGCRCLECATELDLPPIMHELAISQDIIGWDHFMMGMVSRQFVNVQSAYLLRCNSSRLVSSWITGLITQFLQVTHSQWIYRCVLVHDRTTGTLISACKEDLLQEIDHQLTLGPDGLAEEDRFLLEYNFDELATTNREHQEYWLLAIQAAREACRLRTLADGSERQSIIRTT